MSADPGAPALRKGSSVRRLVGRASVEADGALRVRSRRDVLATEEPLEIRTARTGEAPVQVAVTMRTPGSDFELAAGFLYTEGVVDAPGGIEAIRYCVDPAVDGAQQYNIVQVVLSGAAHFDPAALRRNVYTTSSCGVCGKASIDAVMAPIRTIPPDELRVPASVLIGLPDRLRESQALFDRTGGLHAAAVFDRAGTLRWLREDVGRHNAMDKVIGAALLGDALPLSDGISVVSGRLSFELVQKAARAGVPMLAGVSAPSSLAVELAERVGMTLVGFLRGGSFNVYTGPERLT